MAYLEQDEGSFKNDLERALMNGDKCQIRQIILEHGKGILSEHEAINWLFLAAKYCNYELISFLINSDCKLDVEDSLGLTPLLIVLMNEREDRDHVAPCLYYAHIKKLAEKLNGRSEQSYSSSIRSEANYVFTRKIISKLEEKNMKIERICESLRRVGCNLEVIVRFENYHLTKAFVQSNSPWILSGEARPALRWVMHSADLKHLKIVLDHLPNASEVYELFDLLLEYLPRYHRSKAGRAFIKGVKRLQIFNQPFKEINSYHLEEVLINSDEDSIKIFLKYNFHLIIREKCGLDVIPCLFGNREVQVTSLLKSKDIDVNARGYYARTALHFAAEYDAEKNIEFLVDKEAQLDMLDDQERCPLENALISCATGNHKMPDERCIKILLLAGANPFFMRLKYRSKSFLGIFTHSLRIFKCKLVPTIKLLTAELAIHEARGGSVEHQLTYFHQFREKSERDGVYLEGFLEKCRRQVKLMKTHEIRNNHQFRMYKFTMFAIVSEEPHIFVRYINDKDRNKIAKFMKKYRKKIPYYYEKLEKRIDNINQICVCRRRALSIISEITGINDDHHLVVNKIANYLTTKDLLIFR